jgi:diguanylate cyclase (GGDEF)-like protein/PAS domain S-box-containing protein
MEAVSGYRADELIGTQGFDFVHPDDLAADLQDVEEALSGGGSITREWRLCKADGSWSWYEFTLTDLSDVPSIRGIVGHFRDVSDRHTADAALRETEGLLQKAVELVSDGFLAIGPDDRIAAWNPAAARIFGYSAEEAIGSAVVDLLIPPEERARYLERFRSAVVEDMPYLLERPFEMVGMDRAGRRFPVEVSVVQFELGSRFQLQAFVRDIGPRKEIEARLEGHAFTDALTKLPNRALLNDRLALALFRMARRSTKVAVMLLALDASATKPDELSPAAGDELIAQVAQRLSSAVRAADTVARYGNDRFVIVAEELKDVGEAAIIAGRALAAVSAPLVLAGRDLHPSLSIGIAWAETSTTAADDLLRCAGSAMSQAEAEGGGRYAVFAENGAT